MSDQSDDKQKSDPDDGVKPAVQPAGQTSTEEPSVSDEKSSWNPASEPPRTPDVPAELKPVKSRASSVIAWTALLLVVSLGAGGVWSLREAQRREGVLVQRLAALESNKSTQQQELATLTKQLKGQLRNGLAKVETATAEIETATAEIADVDRIATELSRVESASAEQAAQLERMQSALEIQREEMDRFGATDRKDWLLAEAEYLLRLANQRLIMAGDVVAAAALVKSADSILLQLEDVSLYNARAAVAADLASLRAVPAVDVEGLYLRLAALIEQVEQLAIFQLPDASEVVAADYAEDWQARLQQGYQAALHKLSDYIVIRRRDVPYEVLMDPQWEGLVRQNLRMLLEQAQVALLSGNQILFQESLQRATRWVEQFFEVDAVRSKALARDIAELTDVTISVDIPELSRSLHELDQAMERRLQLEDGK